MNATLAREIPDTSRDLRQWLYRTEIGYLMVSYLPNAPHLPAVGYETAYAPETLVWDCDANGEAPEDATMYDTRSTDPVEALREAGYEVAR